jgi:phage shock protein A
MPGIFSRLTDIFKANINDILDKAEDPEKMLKQMVIEMEEAVNKITTGVGSAIANEKQLERQYNEKKRLADEWQARAMQAVKQGRDDLATKALTEKKINESAANGLIGPLEEARKSSASLRQQLDQVKAKLNEARVRQSTLIARHQAAKAKKEIAQSMSGIGDGAFAGFERFEQKVLKAESEADAFQQLAGENASLEDEFKQLEVNSGVEDELAQLKAAMNPPQQ